jgi:acyl-CoA synthetase (NDP forming)
MAEPNLVDARPTDVSSRPLALRDVDIDLFLHPKSVAVIGASETPARPNTQMTKRVKEFTDQHGGTFYPVHPTHETILGVRCYPTIADVPGDVDLAVILTGKAVDTFEEVLAKKAKFAVIFAAGFSEAGDEGKALEDRLAELVRSGETHLLGPNTNLNAFSEFADLPGPSIALITQSGHQGRPVFQGQEIGIALSHWAPTGNEVDLEFADFARYFADQPEVGVIACYIEGFKDGRTLMLAADHAARLHKPIVMVKVGRTDEGTSMARAHTGHLTGADAVVSAVFRQFGVTRVDGLDELLETSMAFARTKPPRGDGVCVYAISGGTGAHMADMVAAAGLRLPELAAATQRRLHDGLIPAYLRVSNPVDCGGPPVATPAGREILDLILADENVDILVVPITGAVEAFSAPFTTDLVDVARTTDKPIFVIWGAPPGTDDTYYRKLLDGGLPVFRTFANCVGALRACVDYADFARRYRSPFADAPTTPLPAAKRARRTLAGAGPGGALSEYDSKQVLKAYGVKSSRDVLCTTPAQAVKAAKAIGYPVVMKVSSPDLLHKSDLGLVEVGVGSDKAVRATFEDQMRRARRAAGKQGRIDGVLVSDLVRGGVEMVVGVSQDPLFGPVVMVGVGGVFVEVLGDVTFRVPPFDRSEAHRMIRELRGFALLEGVRGAKPADLEALVDVIMNVQRLALDLVDDVSELDVNPLVVKPRGAVALDALVVSAPRS